ISDALRANQGAADPFEQGAARGVWSRLGALGRRRSVSPIPRLDPLGQIVLPFELMVDDPGVLRNGLHDASLALRKPAAELVNGRLDVRTDRAGILADIGACVDPRRPAREIVALQRREQICGDLARFSNRGQGHPTFEAEASQVGAKGVAAHPSPGARKNASNRAGSLFGHFSGVSPTRRAVWDRIAITIL